MANDFFLKNICRCRGMIDFVGRVFGHAGFWIRILCMRYRREKTLQLGGRRCNGKLCPENMLHAPVARSARAKQYPKAMIRRSEFDRKVRMKSFAFPCRYDWCRSGLDPPTIHIRHSAQAQLCLPLHSATRLFLTSIVRVHACKDRAMAEETLASTALPAPTPPSTTSPTSSSG